MDKKIKKFTYSFRRGSWFQIVGGMIWSENGDNLFTYLYNGYHPFTHFITYFNCNPNPHDMMIATEEKIIIEGIVNQIIQEDSKPKDVCSSSEDDIEDTNSNQFDFWGDDIEPDLYEDGYGECKVTHDRGEDILSFVDGRLIQELDDVIKGILVRKELREKKNSASDSLEVYSIDIRQKSDFLYSIIYDIQTDVYFICDMKKPLMDIRIVSSKNVMDIVSIFQQRTDFSYSPIHIEINEKHFIFGSEMEQTKVDAMMAAILSNNSLSENLCGGLVSVNKIDQEITVENILLLMVIREQKIIKVLLKNGDVFFSNRCDLLAECEPQIWELNKINQEKSFVLYKRWNETWVKFLMQHLKAITNWKMKANYGGVGVVSNIYYLTNNQLATLGAFSKTCLNWFPEDENAIGVLNGMIKNRKIFWE